MYENSKNYEPLGEYSLGTLNFTSKNNTHYYLLFNFHTLYEFQFSDLYHLILVCDETTSLMSLSWCNRCTTVITPWLQLTQSLAISL